jgi:hypothetical protein
LVIKRREALSECEHKAESNMKFLRAFIFLFVFPLAGFAATTVPVVITSPHGADSGEPVRDTMKDWLDKNLAGAAWLIGVVNGNARAHR